MRTRMLSGEMRCNAEGFAGFFCIFMTVFSPTGAFYSKARGWGSICLPRENLIRVSCHFSLISVVIQKLNTKTEN